MDGRQSEGISLKNIGVAYCIIADALGSSMHVLWFGFGFDFGFGSLVLEGWNVIVSIGYRMRRSMVGDKMFVLLSVDVCVRDMDGWDRWIAPYLFDLFTLCVGIVCFVFLDVG